MFVRNGAVTPGQSRECDITYVEGRPKSAQQLHEGGGAQPPPSAWLTPGNVLARLIVWHKCL